LSDKMNSEFFEYTDEIGVDQVDVTEQLKDLNALAVECEDNLDTPLHAAVRAHSKDGRSFRFESSLERFYENELDIQNNAHRPMPQQTAADLATDLKLPDIAAFLKTQKVGHAKQHLDDFHASIHPESSVFNLLDNALKTLREDPNISLKMKKNTAILMFKRVLPQAKIYLDIQRLDAILHDPMNSFIKQLTSKFELVRYLRGISGYGERGMHKVTTTYKTICGDIRLRAKAVRV
ncbi:unnamed protein product, partial [marine sediment metagenome]